MEVITTESGLFKKVMQRITHLEERLKTTLKAQFRKKWLTNEDVMHLLKISKSTLKTYRREGKIRFAQIGRKLFYHCTDIEAFLKAFYMEPFGQK
ncbi:MAG: helix-turn-helix domain-containing protein [Bacteroidota bacterium]